MMYKFKKIIRGYSSIPSLILVLSVLSIIVYLFIASITIRQYYENLGKDFISDYKNWQISMYITFPLFEYMVRSEISSFIINYYLENYDLLYKKDDEEIILPTILSRTFDYCFKDSVYIVDNISEGSYSISIRENIIIDLSFPREYNYKFCFIPLNSSKYGDNKDLYVFERDLYNEFENFTKETLPISIKFKITSILSSYKLDSLDLLGVSVNGNNVEDSYIEIRFKYNYVSDKLSREVGFINNYINLFKTFNYELDHFNRGILLYNYFIFKDIDSFYELFLNSSVWNNGDISYDISCRKDDQFITIIYPYIKSIHYPSLLYPDSIKIYSNREYIKIPSFKSHIYIKPFSFEPNFTIYFSGLECIDGRWKIPKAPNKEVTKLYECMYDDNIENIENIESFYEIEYSYGLFSLISKGNSNEKYIFLSRKGDVISELGYIDREYALLLCFVGYKRDVGVINTTDPNYCDTLRNSGEYDGYYKILVSCNCKKTSQDSQDVYQCEYTNETRSKLIIHVGNSKITYPEIKLTNKFYESMYESLS